MSQAPAGDPPQGLPGDGAAHLRLAALTLDKGDRYFDDPKARPHGAPGQVDLKTIPSRWRPTRCDLVQDGHPVGPVAAGGVLDRQPQDHPYVDVPDA